MSEDHPRRYGWIREDGTLPGQKPDGKGGWVPDDTPFLPEPPTGTIDTSTIDTSTIDTSSS